MIDKKEYKHKIEDYKKLAIKYYTIIPELEKQIKSSIVKIEYSKGGENIHGGFYCPSLIRDKVIGNCKRGRLLKRTPKNGYTYSYGFDDKNRLIFINKITELDFPDIELLIYEDNVVTAVQYNYPLGNLNIESLSKCIYDDTKLKLYEEAVVYLTSDKLLANCSEIITEEYEYDNYKLLSCMMTNVSYGYGINYLSRCKYLFNYDNNDKIVSYTIKNYDGEKEIDGYWDGYEFPF